jgi:hypothetical protein
VQGSISQELAFQQEEKIFVTSTSDIFQDTLGALALGLQTLPSVC